MKHLWIFWLVCCTSSGMAAIALPQTQEVVEGVKSEAPPFARPCPLSHCDRCPTIAEVQAPGVGIALEFGHATAVVRYHDGSYQNIAQIDGNVEYVNRMAELADGGKPRMPYVTQPKSWLWRRLSLSRHVNKLLGRPATDTTRILARMVEILHRRTEEELDEKVHAVVVSSPDQIDLLYDEITDVLDYLHIHNAMKDQLMARTELYASGAAYAGSGFGLCSYYLDADQCEEEEHYFAREHVLHLDLSYTSLSGTIVRKRLPSDIVPSHTFINTTLGIEQLNDDDEKSMGKDEVHRYWLAVRNCIRTLVQTYDHSLTYLILTGTFASNADFKATVKDALRDLVPSTVVPMLELLVGTDSDESFDPTWTTARGAAEIAKRRQEGPFMCKDSPECQQRRRTAAHRPELTVQDFSAAAKLDL